MQHSPCSQSIDGPPPEEFIKPSGSVYRPPARSGQVNHQTPGETTRCATPVQATVQFTPVELTPASPIKKAIQSISSEKTVQLSPGTTTVHDPGNDAQANILAADAATLPLLPHGRLASGWAEDKSPLLVAGAAAKSEDSQAAGESILQFDEYFIRSAWVLVSGLCVRSIFAYMCRCDIVQLR